MSARIIKGSVIQPENDPLDKGLVGEWRFDKNTGGIVPDYSGYEITARSRTQGFPAWVTTSVGIAAFFDRINNHDLYTNYTFNTPQFSYEAYFTWTGFSWNAILAEGNANGRAILVDDSDNVYPYNIAAMKVAISQDTWYHVVCTYDGNDGWIYLDGKFRATETYVADAGGTFTIGSYNAGLNPLGGKVALVRVYDRVLIANEVAARYQIVRKRMQTFGGERRITAALFAAAAAGETLSVDRSVTNLNNWIRGVKIVG